MPIRRLIDYTGITVWVITLIFALGVMYAQQLTNTEAIAKGQEYKVRVDLIDKDIISLKMQDAYQREWKVEFMVTFKELIKEMKINNEAVLKKMQSTDDNVLRTTYKIESLNIEVQKSMRSHAEEFPR